MRTSELRSICQKGEGELFLLSAYVYRPFTIYLTRLYLFFGIRGNTATFHSLVTGLAAAGLALSSDPICLLSTAFCLQIYSVLDHVDGEVARFDIHRGTQKPSLAGDFFDFWTHFHTINLVFSFMGLAMFMQTRSVLWAILGIVGCNISGNFQRMALATTILCRAARGHVNIRNPKLEPVLDVCCGGTQSKRFRTKLGRAKTIQFLLSEFLGFPGNIAALTVVFFADGIIGLSRPGTYLFRAVYLSIYCAYGVLSKAARTVISIHQLKAVSIET